MPQLSIRAPDSLLSQLEKHDNRSAFIRKSVRDALRRAEWAEEALSHWTENEIRAALSCLDASGVDLSAPLGPQLADLLRAHDSKATAWGISENRWDEMTRELRTTPTSSRALFDLHTTKTDE